MKQQELQNSVISKLEELEKVRAVQRQADGEVQRLKVELATLGVKMSLTEINNGDRFAAIIDRAVDAW